MKKLSNLKINKIKQGRANYKLGLKGEFMVRLWLRLRFYKILSIRHQNFAGEIDLIVKKGRKLCFIEIKSKGKNFNENNYDDFAMISCKQIKRIKNAAEVFLSNNDNLLNLSVRFDIIIYQPFFSIFRIKDAF